MKSQGCESYPEVMIYIIFMYWTMMGILLFFILEHYPLNACRNVSMNLVVAVKVW